MARGYGRRRGSPISPKLIMILAGVAVVLLVGAVFFFAGQAESRKPEQITVSAPAANVGPQAETPAGAANAPTQ